MEWADVGLCAEQQLPCSCCMAGGFHGGKESNVEPCGIYVC